MLRGNYRKRVAVLSLVLCSLLVISSVGSFRFPPNSNAQSGGSSLTIGLVGTPTDPFNPITQVALLDNWIQNILYMPLLTTSPNGTTVPWLAENYTVSSDGLTYTFGLRNNAVWSDGVPITAQDVNFTLSTYITQSSRVSSLLPFAEPSTSTYSGYQLNTSTISIPNNYTVVLHPSYVAPALTAFFTTYFFILPEHVDQGQNLTTNTYVNSHVVTDGPWYLASSSNYVVGSYMELTANPNFTLGKPSVQTLTLQFFQTAASAEAALRSNTIQMMPNVPLTDAASIQASGFTTFDAPVLRVFFVQYNLNPNLATGAANPLSNLQVREALGYATNVTSLVSSISNGYFTVWGQAEPNGMTYFGNPAYNTSMPASMFPYNVTEANDLLNAAGYPVQSNGFRFTITLLTLATVSYFVSAVQILATEWGAVGVNVNVQLQQTTQWVDSSFTSKNNTWNANLYDLTEPLDPYYPPNFLFGPGEGNAGNYTNAAVQTIIYNSSNTAPTPAARAADFQQLDYLVNQAVPDFFMASETQVDSWSSGVHFNDGLNGMMDQPISLYNVAYTSTSSSTSTTATSSQSTVTSSSSSSSSSSSTSTSTSVPADTVYAIVGVLAAIIVIMGVLMVVRRGRT
jgi:peptide/nickel transport system substrate-binding protein